jgi:hypothetical protein
MEWCTLDLTTAPSPADVAVLPFVFHRKNSFNSGLFVLDLEHMPQGCGTWPAFWMCGPNWPNGGEIDIIEGVNTQTNDLTTLHTSDGCNMYNEDASQFTGSFVTRDCYISDPNQASNQGCGISSNSQNFGSGFNNLGSGGFYVTEWQSDHISVWFFTRGNAPGDLVNGNPNTGSWPTPVAKFDLGNDCTPSHFSQMQIIINLTFCGDWAGSVFGSMCPGLGDCNSYVQNNPNAFGNAYWLINSISIYQ